ncbi:MAG: zf-HC2 domain-containing protein [Gemmatimonadales bacterium]
MTSHLEDGTIHELLDGEIPSTELPPVTAHLESCAECRARLDAARSHVGEADDLIESLDEPEQPAIVLPIGDVPHQARPWMRQLAWAASIAVAVGTGYYARGNVVPLVGTAPVVVGETGSEPPRTSAPVSQLPVGDDAREQEASGATRPTPVTAPSATASREVARSDAPAAGGAPAPKTAPTVAQTRQRIGGEFANRLPTDRIGSAAALQPGMMASPTEAAAPAANAPARLARGARPEVAMRDQAASKQATVDTISFQEAVRLLSGRLRLIEGLVPVRLEAIGREVRVIYPLAQGELVLAQSVVDGVPIVRLTAPTGFPADSLDVLRRRVQ